MKFSKFLHSYNVTVYKLTTILDYLQTDFQPPYHDVSVLQYLGNIKLFSPLSSSLFFFPKHSTHGQLSMAPHYLQKL